MKKTIRLGLGPALAALIWAWPLASLSPEAHRLAGIVAWVVCYWMLEPIPLHVTALVGTATAVLLGVSPMGRVASSFLDPILLLFIGSFLLARALELFGLDQRIAHTLLSHPWVGHRPKRMLWALGLVAWLFAMGTSITACVAMLLPIAKALSRREESAPFLLFLTYAASAGAIATPIGTPPNMIGMRLIEHGTGITISWLQWMTFGVPIALTLLLTRYGMILKLFPLPSQPLKPWAIQPVDVSKLSWADRFQWMLRIDWGVIVLFGGGMALGRLMLDTGLAAVIGHAMIGTALQQHPTILMGMSISLATLMSELASNTAAANMVIPILLAGVRDHPAVAVQVALAATLGTSLGFILPVSTPANAMVYGTGSVRMRDLMRAGVVVDLTSIVVIWIASLWLIPQTIG